MDAHRQRHGTEDDLVVGFQLTHSAAFVGPMTNGSNLGIAFRHPVLDRKFQITSDNCFRCGSPHHPRRLHQGGLIASDALWAILWTSSIADKSLLHEFLGALARPGDFGVDRLKTARVSCERLLKALVPAATKLRSVSD